MCNIDGTLKIDKIVILEIDGTFSYQTIQSNKKNLIFYELQTFSVSDIDLTEIKEKSTNKSNLLLMNTQKSQSVLNNLNTHDKNKN